MEILRIWPDLLEVNKCNTHIAALYDRKVQTLKYLLLRLQTLEKPIWRYDRLAMVVQSPVDTYPLFAEMAYIGRLFSSAHCPVK